MCVASRKYLQLNIRQPAARSIANIYARCYAAPLLRALCCCVCASASRVRANDLDASHSPLPSHHHHHAQKLTHAHATHFCVGLDHAESSAFVCVWVVHVRTQIVTTASICKSVVTERNVRGDVNLYHMHVYIMYWHSRVAPAGWRHSHTFTHDVIGTTISYCQ